MYNCLHLDDISIPWESTKTILWLNFFLFYSRLNYASLEGMMDFLAFLVQTLWQNKRRLIREIPTNTLGNS